MKDETAGKMISEVVALKSKAYAVKSVNLKKKRERETDYKKHYLTKKLKGVQKATIKKNVTFDMYKDCLFNQKTFNTEFNIFKSKNHRIYTENITKISLTPNDTKRQIVIGSTNYPDLISTVPFGYRNAEHFTT